MISKANVQAWLGISGSDDIVVRLEAAAVEWIEHFTGRYFGAEEEDYDEYISGLGKRYVWLADEPSTLNAAYYRSTLADDWTEVDSDDLELQGRRLFRTDGAVWVYARDWPNVKVNYDRGYAEDAGPADIEQAILLACGAMWQTKGAEGLQSIKLADLDQTFRDGGFDPLVEKLLGPWRRVALL